MVGISLHTRLGLDADAPTRVAVTLVLPPTPGILVTPPDGAPPKYMDLPSIARLVLDFGDGLPEGAVPPPALLP
jgi:hypothetical protein